MAGPIYQGWYLEQLLRAWTLKSFLQETADSSWSENWRRNKCDYKQSHRISSTQVVSMTGKQDILFIRRILEAQKFLNDRSRVLVAALHLFSSSSLFYWSRVRIYVTRAVLSVFKMNHLSPKYETRHRSDISPHQARAAQVLQAWGGTSSDLSSVPVQAHFRVQCLDHTYSGRWWKGQHSLTLPSLASQLRKSDWCPLAASLLSVTCRPPTNLAGWWSLWL